MPPRVKILAPEQRMFDEIMRFLSQHPPLESVALILPTQRLATLVLATLAARETAFLPPQFLNVETLVDTLFETLFQNLFSLAPGAEDRSVSEKKNQDNVYQTSPDTKENREKINEYLVFTEPNNQLLWPVMTTLEQECLIATLIKETRCQYLRLGHEHEIMQLFNELIPWEVDTTGWRDLEAAIQNNIFLSDGSLDTLALRCQELKTIFDRYLELLTTRQRLPPVLRHTRRIQWILALEKTTVHGKTCDGRPLAKALSHDLSLSFAKTILFAGLSSLTPLTTKLLRAIIEGSDKKRGPFADLDAYFLGSIPPHLSSSQNPLRQLLQALGSDDVRNEVPQSPPLQRLGIKKLPDPMTEIRWCLDQAIALLHKGYEPSSIAILVTDESQYGPYLRMLLPEYAASLKADVPEKHSPQSTDQGQKIILDEGFNTALQMPLKESLLGRWFETLLQWLQFGQGPGDLLLASRFLSHPLVMGKIIPWSLDGAAFKRSEEQGDFSSPEELSREILDRLLGAISHGIRTAPSPLQWKDFTKKKNSPWTPFLEKVDAILSPLLRSHDQKPLGEWAQDLKTLVQAFLPLSLLELPENFFQFASNGAVEGLSPAGVPLTTENIGLRMGSYTGLNDFLEELCQEPSSSLKLSKQEFFHLVERLFNSLKIQATGDPLYGIQILGIPEARYVPFRHIFLVGALEGQFPRALPHDHVLDNSLKKAMGLPGWQLLEAIEDTTFYLLRAEDAPLVLTYAEDGGTSVRSRFIEIALVLGEATLLNDQRPQEPLDEKSAIIAPRPDLGASLRDTTARPQMSSLSSSNFESFPECGMIPLANLSQQGDLSPEESQDTMADLLETLHSQSATSLRSLLQCPYRYLLERALGECPVYEDRFSNQREGKALHRVMELFFSTKGRSGTPPVIPLPERPPRDQSWEDFFTDRLNGLAAAHLPDDLQGSPLLVHMKLSGWRNFARFLAGLYTPHDMSRWILLRRTTTEVSFHCERDLGLHGGPLRLQGRIDSILSTPMGTLVIDFKRKSVPLRSESVRGDDPQLLVYGLALTAIQETSQAHGHEKPGTSSTSSQEELLPSTMLGYYSLIDGTWTGVACGSQWQKPALEKNLLSTKTSDDLGTLLKRFEKRLSNLFAGIVRTADCGPQGESKTHGEPSSGREHPPFLHFWLDTKHCDTCSFAGICRKEEMSQGFSDRTKKTDPSPSPGEKNQ